MNSFSYIQHLKKTANANFIILALCANTFSLSACVFLMNIMQKYLQNKDNCKKYIEKNLFFVYEYENDEKIKTFIAYTCVELSKWARCF